MIFLLTELHICRCICTYLSYVLTLSVTACFRPLQLLQTALSLWSMLPNMRQKYRKAHGEGGWAKPEFMTFNQTELSIKDSNVCGNSKGRFPIGGSREHVLYFRCGTYKLDISTCCPVSDTDNLSKLGTHYYLLAESNDLIPKIRLFMHVNLKIWTV